MNYLNIVERYDLNPSEGKHGKILDPFTSCRVNDSYDVDSFFQVGKMKEHVWWNRSLKLLDNVYSVDEKGIPGWTLPMESGAGIDQSYKVLFNLLLPKNSPFTLGVIKFDENWQEEDKYAIFNATYNGVRRLLTSMGYGDRLEARSNDLFFDGKKFAGRDAILNTDKGFREASIITCYYQKYIDVFDRLSSGGGKRGICGLCEMIPELNEEMVVNAIYNEHRNIIKKVYKFE